MRPTRSCEAYVDGASHGNPGPAGVGVALFTGPAGILPSGYPTGRMPARQLGKYIGQATNNVAEYLALIYALLEAREAGFGAIRVRTDSELMARQMTGRYAVRDAQLKLLHELARHLTKQFEQFDIEHIPRAKNALADRLAGEAVRVRGDIRAL